MSSVWSEDKDTKILWVTMLSIKDKNGYVAGSMTGLAKLAGLTLDECKAAMVKLTSPDADSRTKDNEGRRVEIIDGGWLVLNHLLYREKIRDEVRREYQRTKQAQYRAMKRKIPPIQASGGTLLERLVVRSMENDEGPI